MADGDITLRAPGATAGDINLADAGGTVPGIWVNTPTGSKRAVAIWVNTPTGAKQLTALSVNVGGVRKDMVFT